MLRTKTYFLGNSKHLSPFLKNCGKPYKNKHSTITWVHIEQIVEKSKIKTISSPK